jgi:hypothetical protein
VRLSKKFVYLFLFSLLSCGQRLYEEFGLTGLDETHRLPNVCGIHAKHLAVDYLGNFAIRKLDPIDSAKDTLNRYPPGSEVQIYALCRVVRTPKALVEIDEFRDDDTGHFCLSKNDRTEQ